VTETIPGVLAAAAERYGDHTWLRTDDGTLSFADTAAHVAHVAVRLRDAGIAPGDRVVITARNTPAYLLTWLAVTSLGAVAVTVNPASTATELEGLIAQSEPVAVVTDIDLLDTVDAATPDSVNEVLDVAQLAGAWQTPPATPPGDLPQTPSPDDVAVLIPTSGTTGRSKLVMQTHRAYAWSGMGFPYWLVLDSNDQLMTSLPLFHINAPAYSVMGSLSCGAGLVLLPRFSARDFLAAARRHKATQVNAIGAMVEILMRQPERPDDSEHGLRIVYTGPSPTKQWQEAFERRFGVEIKCGYAMSETPYGLVWPRGQRPYGTLGTPRQHPTLGEVNHARVVDDAGRDIDVGETGELLLRNPVVTPGYWRMPDETAAAIDADGWLHTGDLVTANPDGTYTFVARKKEVLRRRGENLSPAEVEEAVASHPDVVECAVVGVASELTEEEVKAFVVLRAGTTADFPALREWAAQRLSAFKVPRYWQALDALPRTPTQRVAKHRLPPGHPADEYDAAAPAPQEDR
jgi:crotonobetaine/carnitine-CoA ligase